MDYPSILATWDTDPDSRAALDQAVRLTRAAGGHLDVLCLGIDRLQPGFYYAGAAPALLQEGLAQAQEQAEARAAEAEAILSREDVSYTCRAAVSQLGGLMYVVGQAARYADLVVLPRPYGRDDDEGAQVLEAAMFEGDAPALIVPPGVTGDFGRKIVVGWNESAESLRAIRRALPLLKAADEVDIAIVDPERHGPDEADPGSQISRMLARHDVNVSVSVLARTLHSIADVLARHVADTGADSLVMGAYGHSRFRQSILGGATRDTLERAKVPVFMAH